METLGHHPALLWIVLLPFIGSILNGLFGRFADRRIVGLIGVGSVVAAFALAVSSFFELSELRHAGSDAPALVHSVYTWFTLTLPGGATAPIEVRFLMDSLSSVMTLVVTGIGGLIHIYSLGYMSEDKSYARFFAYLNLFMASMLILVLASNVPLMFVGWEGVGLCSYLLIGFWFENRDYAAAGRKAFVANRIGDVGVLIGMFLMVMVAGSFEFADINAQAHSFLSPFQHTFFDVSVSMATITCLLLFVGCTGKSAQIPLFVWLPDAMAGPTPVSALIHAATMVTAGVYLCCRLSPLFVMSETAMAVIAITGTLTALLAASVAMVQREMKRILAYSTVSQLGFMFAAVGVGFFAAGFFHVFTHAFFKACLFLGAGSVMHAVHAHGDADIFKLGGLKKIMPVTRLTFLVSCLAIAGVPLFSGFFSKDEILLGASLQAMHGQSRLGTFVGWFTLVGLTIAATMTAFYMFRLYYLTFTGEYRSGSPFDSSTGNDEHGYDAHPHESPMSMIFPLVVLAVGALIAGYVGLPHIVPFVGTHLPNWWNHWMEASVYSTGSHDDMAAINLATICGLGAMAIGIALATMLYRNKAEDAFTASLPTKLHALLFDKWRVDELYDKTIIGPIKSLAVVTGNVDQTFVDAALTKVPSYKVQTFGKYLARLQTGAIHFYGAAMAVGMLGVAWWFLYPHPDVRAETTGKSVQLSTSLGLGYEYRWDANNDGEFETGWSKDPSFNYVYSSDDTRRSVIQKTSRSAIQRKHSVVEATVEIRNAFGNVRKQTVDVEFPFELLGRRKHGQTRSTR